jgi:uncharacterized SAM-binding protein YcdF (DUF218 family)
VELVLTKTLGALLLPPAVNLLLVLAGALLRRARPRVSLVLVSAGWLSLLAFSLPAVSYTLNAGLQREPALPLAGAPPAQAIVVLGGGRYAGAPEYGGDTVSERALSRVRYAAYLQRRSGLPILVSGGAVYEEGPAEALLLKGVLEDELRVPVTWTEATSRTTEENAVLSAPLLRERGISRFYLVTEASHMGRALAAFRRQGLDPVPAPTRFATRGGGPAVFAWLPAARALAGSSEALYAYLAEAWYRLRY